MELAGFDLILEMHVETVIDAVNAVPFDLGDGQNVSILGGRFTWRMQLPSLPNLPPATVQLICDPSLQVIAQTAECRLNLVVSGASIQAGTVGITMLAGQTSIQATAMFAPCPDLSIAPAYVFPAIDLSQAKTTFRFDAISKSRLSVVYGMKATDVLEEAIVAELDTRVKKQGRVVSCGPESPNFLIVPGVDSPQATQLSAPPEVMWIDPSTLGAFGYLRANGGGGDPKRKSNSDLLSPQQEFMYGQSGLFSTLPARRLGLILSPSAFQQAVACPLVASQVVAPKVGEHQRTWLREDERRVNWAFYHDQAAQAGTWKYLQEVMQRRGTGALTQDDVNEVRGRVDNDAEALLDRATTVRIGEWLSSSEGRQAVIDATPPPCGSGHSEDRVEMPDPFGDVTAKITRLALDLDQGFIKISSHAEADLPICGTAKVDQPFELRIQVNANGSAIPVLKNGEPIVDVDANPICVIVGGILIGYLTGGAIFGLISLLVFKIGEAVAEGLLADVLREKSFPLKSGLTPKGLPPDAQLKEIRIEPSGLAILALLARHPIANTFTPGVRLTAIPVSRKVGSRAADVHKLELPETSWGCAAMSFLYDEAWFDNVWRLELRPVDIPMPLTFSNWTLELGNFSFLLHGVRDVRPTWSGNAQVVTSPTTSLLGSVHYEEPPRQGHWDSRAVSVAVTGDQSTGWQLTFNGADGNFYVRVRTQVTDGTGTTYPAETFFVVSGEELEFHDDFRAYSDDCEKKLIAALRQTIDSHAPIEAVREIPPWGPVWDPQARAALEFYEAAKRGGLGAQLVRAELDAKQRSVIESVQGLPVNMRRA